VVTTHFSVCAQTPYKRNKVVKELKYNIKDGDYKKCVENVNKAFQQYPEETSKDAEFYYYRTVANHNLALAEAKKMYLQDKPDTVKYFNFVYDTVKDGLMCDSLAFLPNAKGKVNNKFHKNIMQIFSINTTKLPAASKFFFQKNDYDKAFDFADLYISICDSVDTEVSTVAAIAVLSGYQTKQFNKAVKHEAAALYDSNRHESILEVVCNCYAELKDTMNMERLLVEGVGKYPTTKYFYATLASMYNSQHKYGKALEVVNEVLKADCCNRDLWFIKGTEEMHLSDRDSALSSFMRAVELKEDDSDSYSNIGNIYLYKSHNLYEKQKNENGKELRKTKSEMNKALMAAKEAYESARKYAEDNPALWLAGLKEVYYKLNMGKELMALEKKYN